MKLFVAALAVVALAGASLYYEWTLYRAVMARIEQVPAPREPGTDVLRVASDAQAASRQNPARP